MQRKGSICGIFIKYGVYLNSVGDMESAPRAIVDRKLI